MLFAVFSALLLLAGTVAATPHHPWKGKWEPFHRHSSFASVEGSLAGFTMSSGTGTTPAILQGTGLVAPPGASASQLPSVSSTESSGAGTPDENPGLPSSSAPAKALSSIPVAASTASKPAPSTPASSSSGGGVSYSATFTEYVFLYFSPSLSSRPHLLQSNPPTLMSTPLIHPRYGLNDGNGSPNCNAATVSCSFYNTPGYNAAVSQNLFGAASGKTDTCGTCWQLDPVSNPNAADTTATVAGLKPIVVMVNNLCPASSNKKDVSDPLPSLSRRTDITNNNPQNSVRSSNSSRHQLRRYTTLTLKPPHPPIPFACSPSSQFPRD